jgi:ATP-dependent DNA ligase
MNDRIGLHVKCMLATLVKKPFHKDGWVYEEKYDGYRILAYKEGRRVTLLSRNSNDRTATFSVIAEAVARLPSRTLLLDGEVVTFDSHWVVAKDALAPYIEGRSNKWLKVKAHQEDEFVIVGYTRPAGARKYFGALLLGAYVEGELRYVGKVGTGFDKKTLAQLFRKLQPLVRETPFVTDRPREKGAVYVTPRLVAEVAYEELTADQKLRQPVFLGLRDDKRPQDVTLPEAK